MQENIPVKTLLRRPPAFPDSLRRRDFLIIRFTPYVADCILRCDFADADVSGQDAGCLPSPYRLAPIGELGRRQVPMTTTIAPSPAHDELAARALVLRVLWPDGLTCPRCGSRKVAVRAEGEWTFRCAACRRDFSPRAGTIFAQSRLPLYLWLRAMRIVADAGGDISSVRLGRELGIRQASAWSLLRRLAAADEKMLADIVAALSATAEASAVVERTPLRRTGMAMTRQELAGKIHAGIRDGSLHADGKLFSEREIAASLRTSRGAVREALIVLETLGYIEVRGKEGMFLRELSEEECNRSLDVYSAWPTEMLPHTFQVRLLLESEAAGLAARNRTDEDVRRMACCLGELSRVCRERPADWSEQGSRLNELFHKVIIEAAHNPVLLRIHEGLLRIIGKAYAAFGGDAMITPLDQWEERVIKGHGVIMEAIRGGDEKAARDAMRRHLEITFTKLDAFYQERIKGMIHNHAADCPAGTFSPSGDRR